MSDLKRLKDLDPLDEIYLRDYLSNNCAILVEPNDDGTLPEEPTFQLMLKQETIEKAYLEIYAAENKKKKLSTTLSGCLWPSDEGDTRVEFRSPVPEFPPPGELRIEDHLPSSDLERLNDIDTVFESSGGDYLSNDCANLVEPNDDGTIPTEGIIPLREIGKLLRLEYLERYAAENKKKKLSTTLSDYLWPSDEGDTRVEFRSPVPEFPPPGELRILLSNTRASRRRKRKADGEYCLAACDDGTVKWIHESECVRQNHVWTVRLFERRAEGVLYLRDELRRPEPNVYNNHCVINYYIGGNVNGSGKQIIGDVSQSAAVEC